MYKCLSCQKQCKRVCGTRCCQQIICIECVKNQMKTNYFCKYCKSTDKPFSFEYMYDLKKNKLLRYASEDTMVEETNSIPTENIIEPVISETNNWDDVKKMIGLIGVISWLGYLTLTTETF